MLIHGAIFMHKIQSLHQAQSTTLFHRIIIPLSMTILLAACSPADEKMSVNNATEMPDFTSFTNVNNKKAAFFDYLRPAYDLVSQEILEMRKQLQDWQPRADQLTTAEQQQLTELAEFYKTAGSGNSELIANLLQQIDILPEALVFSQAANESGWGTSRFARQGYNFFGQWCFSKGCGFVPSQRNADATHEVAKFTSLAASIRSYHRNINRNARYQPLRDLRNKQRQLSQAFNACVMAQGLDGYSERKQEYVNELRNMMRQNRQYWRDNKTINYSECSKPKI